jgi:tRNA(Ile)-lysidine synthase
MAIFSLSSVLSCPPFNAILSKSDMVAVACSGGADSLSATLHLQEWCRQNNKKLIALIVDHAIRPSSRDEANLTYKQLKKINVKSVILSHDKKKNEVDFSSNLQEKARNLRYKLMINYCKSHHISALFIAHHQQDQIETFILRLARGSHVRGLGAMPEARLVDGVNILRPFLKINQNKLHEILKNTPLTPIHDISNDNENFARIFLRKNITIFEKLGILPTKIEKTIKNMQMTDVFLQENLKSYIQKYVHILHHSYIMVDRQAFFNIPPLFHDGFLKYIFAQFHHQYRHPPRAYMLENLISAIQSPDFNGCCLQNCEIFSKKSNNSIIFCRERAKLSAPAIIEDNMQWDNRFYIKFLPPFSLTHPYMIAGFYQAAKKERDFFVGELKNNKDGIERIKEIETIPYKARFSLPIILLNNKIIAMPTMGIYLPPHQFLQDAIVINTPYEYTGKYLVDAHHSE